MTSAADGAAARRARPPPPITSSMPNGFHVNALPHARSECAATLVRRFLAASPPRMTAARRRCPPLRAWCRASRATLRNCPAQALPGNRAGAGGAAGGERRAADLRGCHRARQGDGAGRASVCAAAVGHARPGARLSSDAARSALDRGGGGVGGVDWPGRSGAVHATLALTAPHAYAASSSCSGPRASPRARAVSGTLGGETRGGRGARALKAAQPASAPQGRWGPPAATPPR